MDPRIEWPFTKMHASGNDFVLLDNRPNPAVRKKCSLIARRICDRKTGVGADGLILVGNSEQANCKARFFNSDGSEADMCGNGCRCAVRFAHQVGMAPRAMLVETRSGILHASILNDRRVRIQMPEPSIIVMNEELEVNGRILRVSGIHTGVPHVVVFVPDLDDYPVLSVGKGLRFHERFQPEGANVDFVRPLNSNHLAIRTYERGVEDETLACGTGSVAAALVGIKNGAVEPPVHVSPRGGEVLVVDVVSSPSSKAEHVFLEGNTTVVYSGCMHAEAFTSTGG